MIDSLNKLFQSIEIFKLRQGTRFTFSPLIVLFLIFIFWPWITAGAYGVASVGILAWLIVVLWHEAGHAIVAKFYNLKVYAINITWMGGSCEYAATDNPHHVFWISSAGVLAQAILLILALIVNLAVTVTNPILLMLLWVFINQNFLILVINLLPFANFDGEKIFNYLRMRWRTR